MRPSTFYGFAGISAIAVVAAVLSVSMKSDTISLTPGTEPAFPKLVEGVNQVVKIEIKNSKGSFSITRDGNNWGMDQKEGYMVEFEKVKSAIVNLSEFKLIEKKTSDPERYIRLEVDPPNSPESKGREIQLKDSKGITLASAIIGKLNPNLFGSGGAGTYIRRNGETASWLVRGQVELGEEPNNWMLRTIVNYGQETVKRVVIVHPDGRSFTISKATKKQKNFTLQNIPTGRKIKNPDEANPLAGVMWRMMFDDVKKADNQKWPEKSWVAYFTTWQGFTVKIETAKFGEDFWGRISATVDDVIADPEKRTAAGLAARKINEKTSGWTYMLTAGDSEKLTFPIEEYLAKHKKEDS
ncbi:MAG: hypothetical protein CFH41_01878 [Alphaproteobacteria bacterium MarineAlpha11_Bin1]|nr:MAG: hypothetical protein CFH41_01878 [Alphaproteobacteria bacterium MarineAlpha11_Bin1]|tara:strand:- start:4895 stop:5956 length:1062 start_codon:yes stop_codon:yes gene_type:complete